EYGAGVVGAVVADGLLQVGRARVADVVGLHLVVGRHGRKEQPGQVVEAGRHGRRGRGRGGRRGGHDPALGDGLLRAGASAAGGAGGEEQGEAGEAGPLRAEHGRHRHFPERADESTMSPSGGRVTWTGWPKSKNSIEKCTETGAAVPSGIVMS